MTAPELIEQLCQHLRDGAMELYEIDRMKESIDKAVQDGEKKRFRRFCEESAVRVAKWPAWKRNLLNNSPTMSVPRKPIVHDD